VRIVFRFQNYRRALTHAGCGVCFVPTPIKLVSDDLIMSSAKLVRGLEVEFNFIFEKTHIRHEGNCIAKTFADFLRDDNSVDCSTPFRLSGAPSPYIE
jgi:hypothetical protein